MVQGGKIKAQAKKDGEKPNLCVALRNGKGWCPYACVVPCCRACMMPWENGAPAAPAVLRYEAFRPYHIATYCQTRGVMQKGNQAGLQRLPSATLASQKITKSNQAAAATVPMCAV